VKTFVYPIRCKSNQYFEKVKTFVYPNTTSGLGEMLYRISVLCLGVGIPVLYSYALSALWGLWKQCGPTATGSSTRVHVLSFR